MTLRAEAFPIASPCEQRWERMAPSARGRHCAHCDTEVIELSRMTEREVRARLAHGDVCIRYEAREDGSLITAGDLVAASRLLTKARPFVIMASVVLTPACGDAPSVEAPAPVHAHATPAPVVRTTTEQVPVASCDAPAEATAPAPAEVRDAGAPRRPRRIVMGRLVRHPNLAGGSTPYLTPDDF